MGRTGLRMAVAIVLLAILGSGCSGGGGEPAASASAEASATEAVASETPFPTEPASSDPYAIPDELTLDYVQSVVDALVALRNEAAMLALELDPYPETYLELPEEITALIDAAYGPTDASAEVVFVHHLYQPSERDALAADFRGFGYQVDGFQPIGQCIGIEGEHDWTGELADPENADRRFSITLAPRTERMDPSLPHFVFTQTTHFDDGNALADVDCS